MKRKIRNEGMYITPQKVYGTHEGTCRECRFCSNKKDTGLIGSDAFYCTRFFEHEDQKPASTPTTRHAESLREGNRHETVPQIILLSVASSWKLCLFG